MSQTPSLEPKSVRACRRSRDLGQQVSPCCCCRFNKLRRGVWALLFGSMITVTVAWGCALWTPSHFSFDPFQSRSKAVETADPDGVKGLQYQEAGFGWTFMYLRGEKFLSDVIWCGPYGVKHHRVAGWPFSALRSRVEVLDSQVSGRFSEGQPEPGVKPQRTRWELPWKEILFRGVASKDLPAWFHAKTGRRMPLIPLPAGFAGNTLWYATIYLMALWLGRFLWRGVPQPCAGARIGWRRSPSVRCGETG